MSRLKLMSHVIFLWTILDVVESFARLVRACPFHHSGFLAAKQTENEVKKDNFSTKTLEVGFQLHTSIDKIPADDWNSCLTNQSSPFLAHSWIQALEGSECASPETGWVPQHLSLCLNNETVGYVPLYIKGHSMGEFIFDNAWAEAAYQNNIPYYPKLLVAVPFTPAMGERILLHPSLPSSGQEIRGIRQAVGAYLKQLAKTNQLSSVHINFLTDEEATDLTSPLELDKSKKDGSNPDQIESMLSGLTVKEEYLRRSSLQYHWSNQHPHNHNKPYESFDEYLGIFKSKRRIKIKRERRYVQDDENIQIDAIVGKDILKIDGLVERMFEIYLSTIEKMLYGRQYLTLDFFQKLSESDFIDNLVFMCARSKDCGPEILAKDIFAGTFNVVKNGVFYGRYWGCLSDKDVKNLHFETCYWSAIEYCIKNGLKRMEPGAGGGDYKWARGFDPAIIHSVHYVSHAGLRQAVSQSLNYETEYNVDLSDYLNDRRGKKSSS